MPTDSQGYGFATTEFIEYEFFKPKDMLIPGLMFGGFAVFGVLNMVHSFQEDGFDSIAVIPFALFGLVALVGPLALIRQLQKSVRRLTIDGRTVTLYYAEEVIQLSPSQMLELSTRRRKDDGKFKGRVQFKTGDGRRFYFNILLGKQNGTPAFEWFEKISQQTNV